MPSEGAYDARVGDVVLRHRSFDGLPYLLGGHGEGPRRGYRYRHVPFPDDGGDNEIALFRFVDDIDEDPLLCRVLADGAVRVPVVGAGEHNRRVVEVAPAVFPRANAQHPPVGEVCQLLRHLRAHDGHRGVELEQHEGLALGDTPAADDKAFLSRHVEEEGIIMMFFSI